MKVLACIRYGCSFALERLRASGHEVTILDEEVSFPEAERAIREERCDVFFWDPGAPVPEMFRQVERLRRELADPPMIIFNAMPKEWAEYCQQMDFKNVRVVGFSAENFDADLQAVTQ